MPVDTSIHEGLQEPQDPSGLGAHLASGSTWPQVPPGLRFHLAPGYTWPQVPPGHRFHLATGSTWPQVPPGLRCHLASRSCQSTQTRIACQGFTEVILQGSVNSNVFTALA